MELAQKHCIPCEGGTPPLNPAAIAELSKQIPDWKVVDNERISKEFKFKDFKGSMFFVIKVADIANAEEHHPDIYIFYNVVRLDLSTHAVAGLSENDFILAAKIDSIQNI